MRWSLRVVCFECPRDKESKDDAGREMMPQSHVYMHVICILISFIKCFPALPCLPSTGQWLVLLALSLCYGALHVAGILIFLRRAIWLALSPSLKYFPVRFLCVRSSRFCTDDARTTTQTHVLRKSPYAGKNGISSTLFSIFNSCV